MRFSYIWRPLCALQIVYRADDDDTEDDLKGDPLKGINVDAAGGASKVLRMLAEKVSHAVRFVVEGTPS